MIADIEIGPISWDWDISKEGITCKVLDPKFPALLSADLNSVSIPSGSKLFRYVVQTKRDARPEKILKIKGFEDLIENLKELNLSLVVSKKAKRLLSKNGFSLEYGVRFLRREIQNSIENPLSELLLAGKQFKDVAGVKIDVKNNMFVFEPINFKRKKITNKKQIPTS